jgi:N-acetylglucosaminyl-diphospho-decaprenol L-rhamnosyltransferase
LTPEPQDLEQQAKRISVVIVSHNRKDTLRESLAALGDAHQILVVDNASTDGSAALDDEFPSVRFIRLPKNFGLVKALNVGIRAADGTYVLILHDDAIIDAAAVSKLADYLEEHTEAGAVCPLLLHDGQPAPQVRPLPTPAAPDPPFQPAQGTDAECVRGAAIMFRTFFLRALRQIDERYGNYGSIIELCAQIKKANRKLVILRDVTAEHHAARSPMQAGALEGDRALGTAVYLGKHFGFMTGMLYRLKTGLAALLTFRFKIVTGVFSGVKIDGTS